MAWKKALFLGGAVLLLAACSDATAPNSLARAGSKAAALQVAPLDPAITDIGAVSLIDDADCRSGYYVRSGDKDICIEVPEIP